MTLLCRICFLECNQIKIYLFRKLKGPTIPDFVIKNSSDSCTIIVVAKDKLIAIKEAIWVHDLPHWKDGMHSNDSSNVPDTKAV